MDIMMPEMDGIATMQEIRKLPRGRELPMVAVTAKAMKGDRRSASRPAPGTTCPSRSIRCTCSRF
jgi:CheY-like chemotaxis protein